MLYDIEITEDLLITPSNYQPPPIVRQSGFCNLTTLPLINTDIIIDNTISINSEVNFNEIFYRSMFNLSTNNPPEIKKCNSEIKEIIKPPNLKRIKTF